MSFVLIDKPRDVAVLADDLASTRALALDCEAAGFHRYSDRLCLVQVTTAEGIDYVIDPLAVDASEALRAPLESLEIEVVMHGADYDLRLLDRDLDIRTEGLFDTQAAAELLGEPGLGLAALLESHLGVTLEKKYQRADWARRPLPAEMLDYAASDTRYLHRLAARLREGLRQAGRLEWAREEFRTLERIRWDGEADVDPVTRVKGARDLDTRGVAALREALEWRDEIARERDRAPFRVVQERTLLEIVAGGPWTVQRLGEVQGMNARLARERGPELLARLARVGRLPVDDLAGYPKPERNGRGRPPPEVEDRADRLKAARNQRAAEIGIRRGTLLPNATLLEIAWREPDELDLAAVPGMKKWQVEAVGPALMRALEG